MHWLFVLLLLVPLSAFATSTVTADRPYYYVGDTVRLTVTQTLDQPVTYFGTEVAWTWCAVFYDSTGTQPLLPGWTGLELGHVDQDALGYGWADVFGQSGPLATSTLVSTLVLRARIPAVYDFWWYDFDSASGVSPWHTLMLSFQGTPIPEPGTGELVALGLFVIGAWRTLCVNTRWHSCSRSHWRYRSPLF